MAFRIAMVDGTGASDNSAYELSMRNSFLRTLANQLGETVSNYQRGPAIMGMATNSEGMNAFEWLKKEHAKDPNLQLMLSGYSRGGSAAIMAAERLELENIPVHSMFLFDPVARDIFPGGTVIPANVAFSRSARRSQAWSFVMKYEGTLETFKHSDSSNPIRPFFGNTGVNWRGDGDHQPARVFTGSHGAMGGAGWEFVTEDRKCQVEVSAWMGMQMKSRGLDAHLGPGLPLDQTKPKKPYAVTKFAGQVLDAGLMASSALNRWGGGKLPSPSPDDMAGRD